MNNQEIVDFLNKIDKTEYRTTYNEDKSLFEVDFGSSQSRVGTFEIEGTTLKAHWRGTTTLSIKEGKIHIHIAEDKLEPREASPREIKGWIEHNHLGTLFLALNDLTLDQAKELNGLNDPKTYENKKASEEALV